jgi:hypothetical protein
MAHRCGAVHDEFSEILPALQKLLANPQHVILLLFGQRHAGADAGVDEEEVTAGECQPQLAEKLKVPAHGIARANSRTNARRSSSPWGGRGSQAVGRQCAQSDGSRRTDEELRLRLKRMSGVARESGPRSTQSPMYTSMAQRGRLRARSASITRSICLSRCAQHTIGAGSVLKHQVRVTGVHIPDVSPVRTIVVMRFVAPGARINGVGIGRLERAMPNINCVRATASRTAIRIRPAIDLQHACCGAGFSRMGGIVGGARRHDRNERSRGERKKADIGS